LFPLQQFEPEFVQIAAVLQVEIVEFLQEAAIDGDANPAQGAH